MAVVSCVEDDLTNQVQNLSAPQELDITFNILQDNSGTVTLTPSSSGAASYELFYGDGSEESIELLPGESTERVYDEGVYSIRLLAISLNGKVSEITKDLMVSFRAPENLVIDITSDPNTSFGVIVTATADFATMFEVTFGEDATLPAQSLSTTGETGYVYSSTGDYMVTVTAFSGGAATTTATEMVSIIDPFLLPIDFESATLAYNFIDFGGAASAKVANPDPLGNNSSFVAETTKNIGAQVFAGTVIELDEAIDFTTFQKIKLDSWSPLPAGAIVKMKLENALDSNISTELDVPTAATSSWETLIFDFSAADLTQQYQKVIVFYDFGNAGNSDTFYFDNIELTGQSPIALELSLDFESTLLTYNFDNFGGANTSLVSNPDISGLNTSSMVGNLNKSNGSQVWAGSFIELDNPIDFSLMQMISIKTWSPQSGITVKMKLENLADPNINVEVDVVNTVANAWEELTFDFTGITNTNNYQRVVVFFDFGNAGAGTDYYFDDIALTDGMAALELPVTFEDTTLNYSFTDFGGAATLVIANPDATGINTTATVANLNKSNGSQVWAGSFIELDAPVDFTSLQKIKLKTWSPQSGIVVKMKLENSADANINTEVDVINTVANGWEELTFDFTGINSSNNYQKIVVFFDFGNAGTGVDYYFDEIELTN
ncbi:hypothetical protein BST92_01350 [Nonlabens arenilitoris]|uniref:PKD domain-containing protein n=2 Tax=Nonlabens arenilitoris TaxID=1217969 RepID=A0A2S7U8P0_9FLAO|nr:hypothetical protein BST92_01350 [Nonlabens arenilitoris]